MVVTSLNTRRKSILQAIVELYIETTLPVSSQAITKRLRSQISPATVRNVMAELDELGLIWQPHTSAGRIPTDKGYRFYLDSLIEPRELSAEEKELIRSKYQLQNKSFEDLIKEMLNILSHCSGHTALAFFSDLRKILLKRLELLPVESKKLLVVLVSLEGVIKTIVMQAPSELEPQQLPKIARFLNEQFQGLSLDEIKEQLGQQSLQTKDALFHILQTAAQILDLILDNFDKERLYLEGASYIFQQPEFQNAQALQTILKTFENPGALLEIMRNDLNPDGIKVHIGKENPCEDIQECSLVVSNFKIKTRNMGTLGIIGPRRMSYPKAISIVNYMARTFGLLDAEFFS